MTLCIICIPRQLRELQHTCKGEPGVEVYPPSANLMGQRFTGIIVMPGVRDYIHENYRGRDQEIWDLLLTRLEKGSTLTVVPS